MPDKYTAKVRVTNHASGTILSVAVGHKYSNVYKNTGKFLNIPDGQTATTPEMTVEFNTGWNTTGKDWWVISWIIQRIENGGFIWEECTINPTNFRGIIDFSEGGMKMLVKTFRDLVIWSLTAETLTAESKKADTGLIPAAVAITDRVVDMVMNDESTNGYKQHILRADDAAGGLEILIANDGKLYLKSKSGESETAYSRRRL